MTDRYLECQDCGTPLGLPRTEAQKQQVAQNPYNYVVWCPRCAKENGYV